MQLTWGRHFAAPMPFGGEPSAVNGSEAVPGKFLTLEGKQ
jgi:hypothetical protein